MYHESTVGKEMDDAMLSSTSAADVTTSAVFTQVVNGSAQWLGTSNSTLASDSSDAPSLVYTVLISILLGVIILTTIIGNVFVLMAIFLERNLQTVGNYLVLSLGVADLLVACLVMPLAALDEVKGGWTLGAVLCDMWTCCDVLCCTASILHLLAIAWDRYRTVTSVDYVRQRNASNIRHIILLVWGASLIISSAPIFGWKDHGYATRIANRICLVSQDTAYQIFATATSFYGPLIVTLLLYWKIYQVARNRIRHKPGAKVPLTVSVNSGLTSPPISDGQCEISVIQTGDSPKLANANHGANGQNEASPSTSLTVGNNLGAPIVTKPARVSHKETLEAKRERKAAKTLAIITGVFVVCWLPFFVNAFVSAVCGETCEVPRAVNSLFLWLGYINSMLNPIIYTLFSPDFRNAFHKILTGNRRGQHMAFKR
ncbi:5-hydroxytryptamine receptor 2B-like [Galendromus occidentalis]|uniref:5-hydroxytryptamine receptor 2B-like n=1 Tax=Galendromus occidentalis TaxID=34638 RepID=A0AAJ6VY25_9ACAR|nr:5-hydroxytryptamine receptor 2B-like [Galendromus occidentalis]